MATRISSMDVGSSATRKGVPNRAGESSTRDIQRATVDNENPRYLNATQGATIRNNALPDLNPTKRQRVGARETKAPLGPRPPDFASRRVLSDAPVQVATTPRRSQLPNATTEPFLGLSARKKPSQPSVPRTLPPRSDGPKGSVPTSQSMNGTKARIDPERRSKTVGNDGPTTATRADMFGATPARGRNPALAAARISTASASGSSTVTPLTIRTRKQPSNNSDGLDSSLPKKFARSDLVITKPVVATYVENSSDAYARTSYTQGATRQSSNAKARSRTSPATSPPDLASLNGNGNRTIAPDSQYQTSVERQPSRRLSPVTSKIQEQDLRIKIIEESRALDVQTYNKNARPLKDQLQINGNLARTVSPTDARRPKHSSDITSAEGPESPSPDHFSGRKRAAPSPSFAQQKSDTSSSPRITPDGHQGFNIGQPLSSRSSYNSLRAASSSLQQRAVLGNQLSRNSTLKPRNTHSPAEDKLEAVPPVPAIPSAYGSPRRPSEDQFYFNFEDSINPSNHSLAHSKPIHHTETSASHLASSHDYRHKRGLTIASGLGAYENSSRQASQQMRLPPLSVLPLSKPTTDRIEALGQQKSPLGSERVTPPFARRTIKTPSTPMTASKATSSGYDGHFGYEASKLPAARSISTHYIPRSNSSAGSPAPVFVTPSPAASPAPFSPVGSLGGSLDVEQNQRREKERNEMLSGNLKPTEPTNTDTQTKPFRHFSRDITLKPTTSTNNERAAPIGSPTHRNFSHAWNTGSSRTPQALQVGADVITAHAGEVYDKHLATITSTARRSVSMNPMPQVSIQDAGASVAKPQLPATPASEKDSAKINHVVSHAASPTLRDTVALSSKTSTSILAPVHRVLSARSSLHALKRRHSDDGIDKDEVVADEEMKKLASKRKDFEVAAKVLDELRRRASPKERMSPGHAVRTENLNIFEKGEVIDYNDVYFCGSKTAKKSVGDLSLQAANFGFDDERGDYNIVFGDHLAFRYEVVDLLGKGSFGQVARCIDHKTGGLVAVKIIRNKKRFHQQALVEVNILQLLREWDPQGQHSMINFTQSFYFRGHLCISTELLDMNLYEFIKAHDFRGFSIKLIRRFTKQILSSLVLLQSHNVIHCDLKPENILLSHPLRSELKVIDFGSSCFHNEKVYTYIQSRFYRSPEVLLGMNYSMPIDMWSLGCIVAELLTGYPIFPGENEQEQLGCIMEVFGPPDKAVLDQCSRKKLFFDSLGKPRVVVSTKGKRRRPSSKTLQQAIKCDDEAFLDFVARCLRWDPEKRLKPDEAMLHEFITGKKLAKVPSTFASGSASPTKRYTMQTLSTPRPLPELPATTAKTGTAAAGSSISPLKNQAALRRHSTISGLPQHGTGSRLSSGTVTASGSALPRAIPRSVSGRPDLASAAALASANIRQR